MKTLFPGLHGSAKFQKLVRFDLWNNKIWTLEERRHGVHGHDDIEHGDDRGNGRPFFPRIQEMWNATRYIQPLLVRSPSRTTEIYTHDSSKAIRKIRGPLDDIDQVDSTGALNTE